MTNKELQEKVLILEKELDRLTNRFNKLVTDIVYLTYEGPKPDEINGEQYKKWVNKFSGGSIGDKKKCTKK